MRGSISWQVREVFSSIAKIGQSRHAAKEIARKDSDKLLTATLLASKTGIYSYATLDNYRAVANDCFLYIKDKYGIKDISKITAQQVSNFIKDKINNGASYNTIKTYAAALGKFETALNAYFQTNKYNFKSLVSETKSIIEKPELESRAFRDAQKVIDSLNDPMHKLVASLQYNQGLRVAEVSYINLKKQLNNNTLTIQGKGGYIMSKELTANQVAELKNLSPDNIFKVDYHSYLNDLKRACKANFEIYTGSHAFRHTYAQERYNELLAEGVGIYEAKLIVSEELGHHRIDIVDVYLR